MKIELGKIESAVPRSRRLLFFNSVSQLVSWVACMAAMCIAGGLLIWWRDGARAHFGAPLVGALAGSLPAVWLARPSRFIVHGPGRAQAFSVLSTRPEINVFLASRTGALLRWLLLAVLALRRTRRLAPHPVLFAKIHIYFWSST